MTGLIGVLKELAEVVVAVGILFGAAWRFVVPRIEKIAIKEDAKLQKKVAGQLDQVLVEVRTDQKGTNEKLEQVATGQATARDEIRKIREEQTAARQQLENVEARQEDTGKGIAQVQAAQAANGDVIKKINKAVQDAIASVKDVRGATDDAMKEVRQAADDKLIRRVEDRLKNRFDNLDQKIIHLDDQLTSIWNQVKPPGA